MLCLGFHTKDPEWCYLKIGLQVVCQVHDSQRNYEIFADCIKEGTITGFVVLWVFLGKVLKSFAKNYVSIN
jgi:hypothetical protein